MPRAHCSAASSPESKSLSPASRESQKTCTHSAHPSSQSALLPAACTQTGFPDRNTCTACKNAAQTRTSDTAPSSSPAAQSRTAHSATLPGFPADSPAAVPARDPTSADRSSALAEPSAALLDATPYSAARGPDPDNHAADISPQSLPQHAARIVSPMKPALQVR